METILQLSRRLNHHNGQHIRTTHSPPEQLKYSPTESLGKLSRSDSNSKRIERRKPNWTESENVFLLEQFGLHREILTCKATDASTNLKKQEIWRLICSNLNTHNSLVRRTPAEVRRKWKNLVTAAKKEVWELRHQIHLNGGSLPGGGGGRKISELSQRVLQLHSSGGFSSGNPNGLYGTLLSAGLLGGSKMVGSAGGVGYEDASDKSYIPAHFTPIITLSESNNNHINLRGPPSPISAEDEEDGDSSDSRNAAEFMSISDSGIYEQEGIDLRIKRQAKQHLQQQQQQTSDPGDEEEEEEDEEEDEEDVEVGEGSLIRFANELGLRKREGRLGNVAAASAYPRPYENGDGALLDATLKLQNHFASSLKESENLNKLYRERLELQIQVLKLRKKKLEGELLGRGGGGGGSGGGIRMRRKMRRKYGGNCSYFKLKPSNTWMNIGDMRRGHASKGTNTEVLVNGNSNERGSP